MEELRQRTLIGGPLPKTMWRGEKQLKGKQDGENAVGAEEQLRGSLALRLERQATHMREHHGQHNHHHQHKAGEDGEQ